MCSPCRGQLTWTESLLMLMAGAALISYCNSTGNWPPDMLAHAFYLSPATWLLWMQMATQRMQQTIQRWHCMPESVHGSIYTCICSTVATSTVRQVNGGSNHKTSRMSLQTSRDSKQNQAEKLGLSCLSSTFHNSKTNHEHSTHTAI